MKVQKIIDGKKSFKPYKILIEISVESEGDNKLILKLKDSSNNIYLCDEDGDSIDGTGIITTQEAQIANDLFQNILSNL